MNYQPRLTVPENHPWRRNDGVHHIVSGHGEVIDERGREFDPRTEQDAPKGCSVRGDRSGTIPIPSECYSTWDDRLEPSSQRRTTEPTLLLHPDQHPTAEACGNRDGFFLSPPRLKPCGYRDGFFSTAHVCGTNWRGVVTDLVYRIHPAPPGQDGAVYLLRGRGKRITTTLCTYSHIAGLLINFTALEEYMMHGGQIRTDVFPH